jgi:hypothetical protein
VAVSVTYAVCAFVVAVLPATSAIAFLPLVLVTAAVAFDRNSSRAWHAGLSR